MRALGYIAGLVLCSGLLGVLTGLLAFGVLYVGTRIFTN